MTVPEGSLLDGLAIPAAASCRDDQRGVITPVLCIISVSEQNNPGEYTYNVNGIMSDREGLNPQSKFDITKSLTTTGYP